MRTLPVLGKLPAILGLTVANHIILHITGYPTDYVSCKGPNKMYDALLGSLQSVAQVLGSVYGVQLEAEQIQASESASVNCHVVPLEHVEGNRRFLYIVDPGSSESVLPRNGERCKLNFPEAMVRSTTAQIDLVIYNLVEIVMSVQSTAEFAAAFNREACTLLHRPLTTEEAAPPGTDSSRGERDV